MSNFGSLHIHAGAAQNSNPVCDCVFLYLLQVQNPHSTSKVRTFYEIEGILAGNQNFKGMFEDLNYVYWLELELGQGRGNWVIYDVYSS